MANMKTGLSYFENGGEVEETTTPALAKAVPPKGKYAVSAPIGAVPLGQSTLENMQRLLEEKQAQQGSLLERLKDAKSVFSGYGAEQSQAMDLRNKQREEQAANIFQMRNQIEQQKAAQAQLANLRAEDAKSGWGMPQAGDTAIPGAAPAEGAIPTDIALQYNTILNQQGRDKAIEFKNKYLQEKSKASFNPNLDPIIEFTLPNGELKNMRVSQAQALADRDPAIAQYLSNAGVPVRPSAAAPGVVPRATTTPSAATTTPSAATTTPSAATTTPSAATTTPSAATTTPSAATTAIRTPTTNVAAATPVGGTSVTAAKARIALDQKQGEAVIAGRQREYEKLAEKGADIIANIEKAGRSSTDDIARYDKLDKLTTSNPYAFGVLQKPGILSGALKALSENTANIGNYNISIPGIETFVRNAGGTEDDITAANMAAREFAGLQLNAIKLLQGTGSVSDAEQKLLERFSGSNSLDVRTIKDLIKWGRARSEYDRDVNGAWEKWQKANPGTTSREFYLYSKDRAELSEAWKKKTQSMLEDYEKLGNKPSGGARAELEKRREARKKQGESK